MIFLKKIFKYLLVMIFSTLLVTLGIDAADNYDNLSQSIVAKTLFGSSGPCPPDMVFVPFENGDFCIDKYEASPNKKCPVEVPKNQQDTRINLTSAGCGALSEADKIPWAYISQAQAREACVKAEKRLPSNEEWFAASLGTPDIKNSDWESVDCHLSSNWSEQPGRSGTSDLCQSAYGAYDMVGNVWEWVSGEIIDGKFNGRELPEQGFVREVDINGLPIFTDRGQADPNHGEDYLWIRNSGIRGMARGGFWDNKKEGGIYASYLVSEPSFAGNGIGFRCVK